jgi:hypothetical protein
MGHLLNDLDGFVVVGRVALVDELGQLLLCQFDHQQGPAMQAAVI